MAESQFTAADVPVFEDFKFTPESFQEGVKTQGLSNITAGIVDIQSEIAPPGLFSYETLRDGSAPLLNFLPGFSDIPVEKRKMTDEDILPLFSNVQDFGGEDEAQWLAMLEKAKRTTVPAAGMSAGAITSVKAASKLPIPHPIAKFGTLALAGIGGALFGDYLGSEAEEYLFGEEYPVTPSLQAATNAAETAVYGISMLGTPWALPTKEGAIGAVRVLDNWKKVTQGGRSSAAAKGYFDPHRMAELIAAEEALGAKVFQRALKASAPTGNVVSRLLKPDPTKGPLSLRILGGLESGIAASGRTARNSPYATLFYETLAIGGSSVGSFGAETIFPGSPGYRFIGEVGGAGLPPLLLKPVLTGGAKAVRYGFDSIVGGFSGDKKARFDEKLSKSGAGKFFRALEDSNEVQQNPELIDIAIRVLGEELVGADGRPITDVSVSAFFAAKGQPELARVWARIEQSLGRTSDELAIASVKGREAYIQGAKQSIISALDSGDVAAMQGAAFVAERLFHDTIANSLDIQISNITRAADRVTGRNRRGGANPKLDLAVKLKTLFDQQLSATKEVERTLWDAVGDAPINTFYNRSGEELTEPNFLLMLDTPLDQGGVRSASKGGRSETASALGGIKQDIDDFIQFFRPSLNEAGEPIVPDVPLENPVTASRLYDIRSQLLEKATYFRNQGKNQTAMKMERLAGAVLDDLLFTQDNFGDAYNMARAYTKARNDVFTRSFLGDLQDTTQKGGPRVSAEALVDKIFGGGSNATYLRLQDIMSAGKFVATQGNMPASAVNRVFTIHETLEEITRDQMSRIMDRKPVKYINPETGGEETKEALVVNPKKLKDYVESAEGQAIFRMFPQLKLDLEDASSAQRMFDSLGEELKALKVSPETKAFQSVLESNTENPSSAVASALRSKKPAASLNELLDLANRAEAVVGKDGVEYSKQQVKDGLRTAILDWALTRAGGTGYAFNPKAMQDALFGTVKGADPKSGLRVSSWLLENDLIDKEHLGQIQQALKEMVNVEEAFMSGDVQNVLFDKPSGMKMFQARMIGATIGARSQQAFDNLLKKFVGGGSGIGGGFVAANEGSKQMINLFFKVPEAARIRVMGEILKDRRKLGVLLQQAQTDAQASGAASKIQNILVGFGFEQMGRRTPYIERAVSEQLQEDLTVTPPSYTEEEEPTVGPVSSVAPTAMPAPQPVPAQPVASPPTTTLASAAPPPPPPAASGPVDRRRFAAMFPEDRALVEGIGSLMG
jgi:hypothetical protein